VDLNLTTTAVKNNIMMFLCHGEWIMVVLKKGMHTIMVIAAISRFLYTSTENFSKRLPVQDPILMPLFMDINKVEYYFYKENTANFSLFEWY
jgi:hypothetical protein